MGSVGLSATHIDSQFYPKCRKSNTLEVIVRFDPSSPRSKKSES